MSVDFPAPLIPTSATRSPRLDHEVRIAEDEFGAVALADVFELGDDPTAGFGLREFEMNRLFVGGNFNAFDFLQLFDARLHLLRLCRLRAEAIDERL